MNLYSPYVLLALCLIPLMVWLIWRSGRRFKARFSQYAETVFMQIYLRQRSPFYSSLKLVLLVIAFAFIILAMARPQWDFKEREISSQGMDIIFAIDVSRSMEATDIQPNRLTRSILQVSAFVDQLKTDRLGVISFAGAATIECPLTEDYEAVKMVLSSLSTDSAARAGTEISRALDAARAAFQAGPGPGVLVLISDGEDLSTASVAKARDLASDQIRIYTMGVGSEEGAIIRNPYTGEERLSKLDVASLQRIAEVSGGEFFRITPSAAEIQLLLSRIYQSEKRQSNVRTVNLYKEQYHLFVLAALIFIILESLILPLKRQGEGGRK
ncbi:MAG: VWA domain-containing protein [Candidatus Cloacimonadaceae bacterium]|nr:VWA domain-containing protein [Candidatus Cloacimonadota bacterium]MDY0127057.1 VWA domain-containing protein [Candidatus Cloacimonadaceae bacterium]MCB5255658.1 VWA domain-containing protein [Candidatus Cloacimonadota bacterium]MCK9178451.1 VWA domain-containing protein [Candidatus Cloacimonadota bacterium]MCK9242614.1 VWA domain-containing protein [Candidatus Cloacimonadota bacterium]